MNKPNLCPLGISRHRRKKGSTMYAFEIILAIVATLVILPFLANKLAKENKWFTHLESGNIKFVMYGQTLHKIIHNVKGYKLNNKGEFEQTTNSPIKPPLGLYWIGIYPFARVHTFSILKERENPTGKNVGDWITRDKEGTIVSSLRFTFPRPYTLEKVELGDRIPVDLLVVAKFEVVDPYKLIFFFKGKFFENAGASLRATVSDILKGTPATPLTLDDFVKADKGEATGILSTMKDPTGSFNTELVKQVGLRLVGIAIPQYDPSDSAVRDAMNAQTIAEEKAKGLVAEATGHAKQLAIRVEADAKAKERMAQARGVEIKETVAALAASTGNPDIVARGAADILEMEAAAGEKSSITTIVKGTGASPVLPIGGVK